MDKKRSNGRGDRGGPTSSASSLSRSRPNFIPMTNAFIHGRNPRNALDEGWYQSLYWSILDSDIDGVFQNALDLITEGPQNAEFKHHIFHSLVTAKPERYDELRLKWRLARKSLSNRGELAQSRLFTQIRLYFRKLDALLQQAEKCLHFNEGGGRDQPPKNVLEPK